MRTGIVAARGGSLFVSKIILGTCYYGTDISEKTSYELLDTYYAAGGRSLDTARVYGLMDGVSASERIVGAWMQKRKLRDQMILITKGGFPQNGNMHQSRLSRGEILSDFEASLRELQTNYVDIYYLHRDDPTIPVAFLMDTLHELVESGRVRAIGASNWTTDRIDAANRYAIQHHKTPFTVSEIQWSYALSTPESWNDDTLVCMNESEYQNYLKLGIPVMAFSPQAKGVFSKYIAGGRSALSQKVINRFLTEENLKRIDKVRKISLETGLSPAAVVLNYIICNPLEGFAIVGCSNQAQLLDSLTADGTNIGIDRF